MKSISVKVGGKDLTLRGDDEEKIRRSANEVDTTITELQQRMQDQSTTTITLLAALNIAEKYDDTRQQHQNDVQYLKQELGKMSDYLEKCCDHIGSIQE
ncbi:MAG: cell division protein ZapA [Candidatus Kapaibacterium sp.]